MVRFPPVGHGGDVVRADRLMHYDAEYPMPPWRSIDIDTSADLYEACKRLSEVC